MSNSVGVLGQFMLTYDGAGSAGLGGLDFASSYDRIDVDFTQVQGQGDLTLEVTDTSGGTASIAETVNSSGVVSFPFASFAGVDFAAVDIVKLTLDTTEAASDFEINEISREGVPEPTAGLLAGLSLVSLLGLRRRRK